MVEERQHASALELRGEVEEGSAKARSEVPVLMRVVEEVIQRYHQARVASIEVVVVIVVVIVIEVESKHIFRRGRRILNRVAFERRPLVISLLLR